jgi:hypothetical protein
VSRLGGPSLTGFGQDGHRFQCLEVGTSEGVLLGTAFWLITATKG